jgi:putative tricarboxylic transport membrane protein
MLSALLSGLADAVMPLNLAFITLGIVLGYLVGILPGLNRPTAIAIMIPLTFYLPAVTAISFLIGIAKGSATGGAATAILINTPGESSSAATCIDGYPLTKQGFAEKALKVAVLGSVIGDILATIVLIAIAQPLARFALAIGPFELAAILVFALTFIAGLSGSSLTKGLIAGALGALCATPGIDAESGAPRLTFGSTELFDGVPIIAVTIGMLALSEMIWQIEHPEAAGERGDSRPLDREANRLRPSEVLALIPTFLRSSAIGIVVGVIPGLGASVGSFMSYGAAQRASRTPELFGHGAIEGVAAAETADNAVVPASLVPLFAIGVPGSVAAALLMGAFTIHGVTPGPAMFERNPQLIAGVYAGMIIASLVMLVIGWYFLRVFARVAQLPTSIVVPVVIALCLLGAYMEGSGMFGVYLMLGFALLGYVMRKLEFSLVTFLVGFIIGPLLEQALRQSIIIADGRWTALLDHPIAVAFLAIAAASAFWLTRSHMLAQHRGEAELKS